MYFILNLFIIKYNVLNLILLHFNKLQSIKDLGVDTIWISPL